MKRKQIGMIPVQATTKSRRQIKMKGRGPAIQGRPRLVTQLKRQLEVGDDDEDDGGILRHKLPSKKNRKVAVHSLMESVRAGKSATKKH